MKVVITGNPGVGKHTCGGLVAAALIANVVDLNKLALEVPSKQTEKGLDVDVRKLSLLVSRKLRKKMSSIVIGHLAPYVVYPGLVNTVVVLRKSPYELLKTLQERGYSTEKIKENVESEILGVTLNDSIKTFGRRKVAEFDVTGKTSGQIADQILSVIERKSKKEIGAVDWLALVSARGDMKRFFDYEMPARRG